MQFTTIKQLTLSAILILITVNANAQTQQFSITALDVVIDAPKGFLTAENFNGLLQPETFSTIKYREELVSFSQLSQAYLKQIKPIVSQQKVTISDRQGVLVQSEVTLHGNQFNHWTLLFGDDISTIILEATVPKMMGEELNQSLKDSLLAVRWLRLPRDQQFQGLPFVLDETEQLRIARRNNNSIILTDKSEQKDDTIAPLLVVSSAETKEEIIEIEALSNQLLRAKRFAEEIKIVKQQATKINKIMAFHVHAQTTDKQTGKPLEVYQTVAYNRKKFLLLQGIVEPSQKNQLWPQFEQVANSIKFKAKL